MAEDKKRVECPVCGKYFFKSMIQMHVDTCLDSQNDEGCIDEDNSSNSDGAFPLSLSKKPKVSDATVGLSSERPVISASQSRAAWKNIFSVKSTNKVNANSNDSKLGSPQTNTNRHIGLTLTNAASAPSFEQIAQAAKTCMLGPPQEDPQGIKPVASIPVKLDLAKLSIPTDNADLPKKSNVTNTSAKRGDSKDIRVKTAVLGSTSESTDLRQSTPLSEQMRPKSLEEFIGQTHLLGKNKMLRTLLMSYQIPSMILWGPPGCGKTTLARIIAERCRELSSSRFVKLSATTCGLSDVREAIKHAKNERKLFKRKTILFIDEIHRFNKLQQDTFLPHVEDGTITLIGATTENPGFQVNNALLSRCRVIILEKLSIENLTEILKRSAKSINVEIVDNNANYEENNTVDDNVKIKVESKAISTIAGLCDGDARAALNCFQAAVSTCLAKATTPVVEFPPGVSDSGSRSSPCKKRGVIGVEDVKEALQRSHIQYDIAGEEHYNCASALQKSIRGSDENGAIYWLARMLEGGEDPLFIARRLLVCASEDIGLADPQAMQQAVATFQTCNFLGVSESKYALAQCTVYLARAPKSIEAWTALSRAQDSIKNWDGPMPGVPLHLRNATNKVTREAGYGRGYQYGHTYVGDKLQSYLPKELEGTDFFSRPEDSD